MSVHPDQTASTTRWNRRLLHTYWVIVLVSVLIASANLFMTPLPLGKYALSYIVWPTAILVALLLVSECLIRKSPRSVFELWMIVSATGIATTLAAVHADLSELNVVFILPLLASSFFFKEQLISFAFVLATAAYLTLTQVHPDYFERASVIGLLTMLTELALTALIALTIMRRGRELFLNLRESLEQKQDLMVRNAHMEKLTKVDPLTGLYNHRSFHEFLEDLIAQCDRQEFPLFLAVLDIDNFKKVNDVFGHRTGDLVLRWVATKLQENVKPDDFVSRYGGEEFAILFTDQTGATAFQLVERIREAIAAEPHAELGGANVSVSVGLHRYRQGMGKEAFFEGADASLYQAKRSGKNRVVIYDIVKT